MRVREFKQSDGLQAKVGKRDQRLSTGCRVWQSSETGDGAFGPKVTFTSGYRGAGKKTDKKENRPTAQSARRRGRSAPINSAQAPPACGHSSRARRCAIAARVSHPGFDHHGRANMTVELHCLQNSAAFAIGRI